jgi:hypothetical protein
MKSTTRRTENLQKLSKKELIERAKKFAKKFAVTDGKNFKLKDYNPEEDGNLGPEDKPFAKQTLELGTQALAAMQDVLYAQISGRYSSFSRQWMQQERMVLLNT